MYTGDQMGGQHAAGNTDSETGSGSPVGASAQGGSQLAPPQTGQSAADYDGNEEIKRSRTRKEKVKDYGKQEFDDWRRMWTSIQWIPSGKKQVEKELDEDSVFKNTIELQENPLTALFLCVASDIWSRFPISMQFVFLLSTFSAAFLQWVSSIAIWRYLVNQKDQTKKQGALMRMVGTYISAAMLFLYLLGDVRKAWTTWQIALPRLGRDSLGWYCAFGLFADILLHFFVSFVCVMAIGTQDNISEKVQASLAFFFICEVDEWMYVLFIQPFDVLDSEDFVIEEEASEEEKERLEEGESKVDILWDLRARQALRWGAILFVMIGWAVAYTLTF